VGDIDLSEYCRGVEEHLTRVNGGHLVRIVGAGFSLVQGWADAGMPLSVVRRGIDRKAERHARGRSRRPLRIEFCDADVRDVYDEWRRALGIAGVRAVASAAEPAAESAADDTRKRPSLTKHLDRVVDRLGAAAGRADLPHDFQRELGDLLGEAAELRDAAKGARGEARDACAAKLEPLDGRLMDIARAAAGPEAIRMLETQASLDLAAYRDRLTGDAWKQAVDATVARLLRDRYGLPDIGNL
jgi:hypothetical protein